MAWLKNIFLTALLVIGATMATAAVAATATMVLAVQAASTPVDSNMAVYGAPVAILMAAVLGLFFSFATLTVAVLTMPLSLWFIRGFRLPRPLFDIFGGGAAGLICAGLFASFLESVARAKGGNLASDDVRLTLDLCAMLGGAAVAYVRHALLVRSGERQTNLAAEAAGVGQAAPL